VAPGLSGRAQVDESLTQRYYDTPWRAQRPSGQPPL